MSNLTPEQIAGILATALSGITGGQSSVVADAEAQKNNTKIAEARAVRRQALEAKAQPMFKALQAAYESEDIPAEAIVQNASGAVWKNKDQALWTMYSMELQVSKRQRLQDMGFKNTTDDLYRGQSEVNEHRDIDDKLAFFQDILDNYEMLAFANFHLWSAAAKVVEAETGRSPNYIPNPVVTDADFAAYQAKRDSAWQKKMKEQNHVSGATAQLTARTAVPSWIKPDDEANEEA